MDGRLNNMQQKKLRRTSAILRLLKVISRVVIMVLVLMAMPLARGQMGWTEANIAGYFGQPANIVRSITAVDSCYPLNCDIIVEQWVYRYPNGAVQLVVIFENGRVAWIGDHQYEPQ
jgi:hypothetical protein